MDKRLIFQIDGNYYAMGYPTMDILHNIIFGTGAKDTWDKAKNAVFAEKMTALTSLVKDAPWSKYRLNRWLQEPFAVAFQHAGTDKKIVRSCCAPVGQKKNFQPDPDDILLECQDDADNMVVRATSGPPVGIRILLEPVDITGKSLWTEAIRDHEDGEIVHMGSLYLDGEPVSGTILLQGNADFCIDDTYDDDLAIEWTYHLGCLFPTDNLFRAYPSAIQQLLGKP